MKLRSSASRLHISRCRMSVQAQAFALNEYCIPKKQAIDRSGLQSAFLDKVLWVTLRIIYIMSNQIRELVRSSAAPSSQYHPPVDRRTVDQPAALPHPLIEVPLAQRTRRQHLDHIDRKAHPFEAAHINSFCVRAPQLQGRPAGGRTMRQHLPCVVRAIFIAFIVHVSSNKPAKIHRLIPVSGSTSSA